MTHHAANSRSDPQDETMFTSVTFIPIARRRSYAGLCDQVMTFRQNFCRNGLAVMPTAMFSSGPVSEAGGHRGRGAGQQLDAAR